MINQLDPTSPFLEENLIQPIVIEEREPKILYSDLHTEIYRRIEESKKQEKGPLRYT